MKNHPKDVSSAGEHGPAAFDCLTVKQRKFVLAYVRHGNATQAAIDAGYSRATARSMGSENLTKHDIRACLAEALERAGVTDAELDARLQGMLRGRLADLEPVVWGQKTLKQLEGEGVDTSAVKSLKVTRGREDQGPTIALEIESPLAAIMALAKLRGLLVDRSETSVSSDVAIRISNDRAAELCRETLRRLAERNAGGCQQDRGHALQAAAGSPLGRPPILTPAKP